MEVLKVTTDIDSTGKLDINLPTSLSACKVDVVVIVNPVSESKEQLDYDFSDLAGKLSWQGDAVATQRNLRDEW